MGITDTIFGTPPSSSVAFAPGFKAPGFNFARSLSEYLTGLIGQPGPEYQGKLDPGLSPTLANLGQMMQGYATSPAPYIMGQAAGTLGKFMSPTFGNPQTELATPGTSYFGGAAPGGKPGVMPGGSPFPGGPSSPVPGSPPPFSMSGNPGAFPISMSPNPSSFPISMFPGPLASILGSLGASPGQGPALSGGLLSFGPPLQAPGSMSELPRTIPLPAPKPSPNPKPGERDQQRRRPTSGGTSGASMPSRNAKPLPARGAGGVAYKPGEPPSTPTPPPIFRKPFGGGGVLGGGRG